MDICAYSGRALTNSSRISMGGVCLAAGGAGFQRTQRVWYSYVADES
jgi:hypothetical protein